MTSSIDLAGDIDDVVGNTRFSKKIHIMLALVWLVATPSWAKDCQIGPITVDAPSCDVKQEAHSQIRYIEWDEGKINNWVRVIPVKKRLSLNKYFSEWRHQNKCTVKVISFGRPLHFTSEDGHRKITPPQKTWTGRYVAPGEYLLRAIKLKRYIIELRVSYEHVLEIVPLRAAFSKLLDGTRLSHVK